VKLYEHMSFCSGVGDLGDLKHDVSKGEVRLKLDTERNSFLHVLKLEPDRSPGDGSAG